MHDFLYFTYKFYNYQKNPFFKTIQIFLHISQDHQQTSLGIVILMTAFDFFNDCNSILRPLFFLIDTFFHFYVKYYYVYTSQILTTFF